MSQRMRDRQWRGTAVLVSILLHLVFLGALPGWRNMQPLPVPIVARLLPGAASLERAAPLPQAVPALAPSPPRKRAEPQREVVGAREAFVPSVDSAERLQESSTSPVEASASVAAATRVAPGLETIPSTPASHAIDAGSVAQYRLAIISLAKTFNRYPRLAVENNWQGRAEVRVAVGADGSTSLRLRFASGHELLDRQALDMIGRAASQVALPAVLRGREFTLDIPVVFSLRDAER